MRKADVVVARLAGVFVLASVSVATPATAVTGLVVQVSVPDPGFVPIARVTLEVFPVTVLPNASCTVTTGWVDHAAPPVPPVVCVVKASFAATPAVTLNVDEVAEVNEPSVAVRV